MYSAIVLKYIHKIFDPPPFRKCSLIPSSWMWAGLSDWLVTNILNKSEVMVCIVDLVIQGIVAYSLFSLGSLTLWEASCHIMRILIYGNGWYRRNWGLWPTASKEPRQPANSNVSGPLWSGCSSLTQAFGCLQPWLTSLL